MSERGNAEKGEGAAGVPGSDAHLASLKREVRAMRLVVRRLERLSPESRVRVMRAVAAFHGFAVPASVPTGPASTMETIP